MRNESQTMVGVVSDAVVTWMRREHLSREAVVQIIVEVYEREGGPVSTGLEFDPPSQDPFKRMKTNAERVFRWLDDRTKDNNLLPPNMLPYVLAALPVDLRIQVVNMVLRFSGLGAHVLGESQPSSIIDLVQVVVREGAEATAAIAGLVDGFDTAELAQVRQQVTESISAGQRALATVESLSKGGGS